MDFVILPGLAGAIVAHKIDHLKSKSAALAGVYLMGFYNVPWILMLGLVGANTSNTIKNHI